MTSRLWPLHAFALLLAPLMCWQVWIFPQIPNYYLQHALVYPTVLVMLWAWSQRLWTVAEAWRVVRPFLPWLAAVVVLQGLANWQSANLFQPPDGNVPFAVAKGLAKLLVQVPFVVLFLMLARVILRDGRAPRLFLYGAVASFVALALWCLVQIIYVYGHRLPFLQGPVEVCKTLLTNLSPLMEARWKNNIYDFYKLGAYSLTLGRVNGFFEEASALASNVAVFYVPLAFGLLGLGNRKAAIAGFAVLVGSVLLLALSTAATALPLLGCILVLCCLRFRHCWRLMLLGLCLCAVVGAGIWNTAPVQRMVRAKPLASMQQSPRVVCTLASFDLVRQHPLLGTGRDWYFPQLHNQPRYLARLDHKEIRTWKERGSGGELSAIAAFLAQYGLPVGVLACAFLYMLGGKLKLLSCRSAASPCVRFVLAAWPVWLCLGFVAGLAALDIRNPFFSAMFFAGLAVTSQNMTSLAGAHGPGEGEP